MSEPTKTALHDKLEAMGATFSEDGGWWWFETLGDVQAEYNAVRTNVAVWDLSPLIKWEFKGPQAAAAADFINANDIVGAKPGQVRYGPFLNAEGAVLDDGTIYKISDEHVLVMTNDEGHGPHFAENLSRFDVEITNIAREMPHLAIQGPNSRKLVQSLTDVDLDSLKYFWFIPEKVQLAGASGYLARTGFSGELGFEFFTTPDQIGQVFDAVFDKGAIPFGVAAIYPLRLEAGLLIPGYDYEPGETNPYDCGLDKFVGMDKEDFLGRKALEAVAGDPPNRYKTLVYEGDIQENGSPVTKDGQPVGVAREGIESPAFGNIAGACLAKEVAVDGETVEVNGVRASVHPWGIYDPEKKRPRS
ncbi:MAG: aminomethyltransferase family protein [Actinobacteria bacterium]|nr:aminomethyltransferase family protein [Actinomycetota bacterium]